MSTDLRPRSVREALLVDGGLVLVTAACCGLVLTGVQPLAAVGGLPLLLLLPGVAVVRAVFGGTRLLSAERLAVGAAATLAVTIAVGLTLSLTGVGINRTAMALACAGVTCALAIAAAFGRGHASLAPALRQRLRTWGVRQAVLALVAVALLGGAAALSIRSEQVQQHQEHFTSLFAVPTPQNSPRPTGVDIGVLNREGARTSYVVTVTDGVGRTLLRKRLAVGAGRAVHYVVPLVATSRLTVNLYRADAPTKVYRSVFVDERSG